MFPIIILIRMEISSAIRRLISRGRVVTWLVMVMEGRGGESWGDFFFLSFFGVNLDSNTQPIIHGAS